MQPSYSERQVPLRGKGRAEQQPAIDQLEDLGGAGGLCNAAFVAIQAWVIEDLRLRSEVNIELNFPPKLRGARSRLYRRRFLQVNTRWKALAEIYTMHSFAPFSNLNFFVKNRQNNFAIE